MIPSHPRPHVVVKGAETSSDMQLYLAPYRVKTSASLIISTAVGLVSGSCGELACRSVGPPEILAF